MSKSILVHLKNKYPHCYVGATGSAIEVIGEGNEVIVSLARDCHGQMVDRQHEVGARDAFCLAPIPREARVWKLAKNGMVERDEKHDERRPRALELAKEYGKVPSIDSLIKAGKWDQREEKILKEEKAE